MLIASRAPKESKNKTSELVDDRDRYGGKHQPIDRDASKYSLYQDQTTSKGEQPVRPVMNSTFEFLNEPELVITFISQWLEMITQVLESSGDGVHFIRHKMSNIRTHINI